MLKGPHCSIQRLADGTGPLAAGDWMIAVGVTGREGGGQGTKPPVFTIKELKNVLEASTERTEEPKSEWFLGLEGTVFSQRGVEVSLATPAPPSVFAGDTFVNSRKVLYQALLGK